MTRRTHWSKSFGSHTATVRLVARGARGFLWLVTWDPRTRKHLWERLGHSDRELGERQARALAGELLQLSTSQAAGRLLLVDLFTRYTEDVSQHKKGQQPAEDRRRIALFTQVLGPLREVQSLDVPSLNHFVRERRAGRVVLTRAALDKQTGAVVTKSARLAKHPSERTIDADLVFLQSVLNWATQVRLADGSKLLAANPVHGYQRLTTARPKRPIVTYDRFLAVLKVADQVDPQRLFGPFLRLVEALGWRVTALCSLWYSDIDRKKRPVAPHGRLRKRATVDKEGVEQWVPLSEDARAALDLVLERHPGIGDRPIFPAPRNSDTPWTRWHARDLLERAEAAAEVDAIEGGDFHPYRRKWATERKHLPTPDVMEAGGWKDRRSLEQSYQRTDPRTVLAVVSEPTKLREVK